ncbi:tetratricopeptide repeat protein [Flavobacterium rhizosphaerae]|uniref:Tetratricopeptide repeat protein n=1 Tax=Flavobacterium rhizosphaerae TaxID=3163298 RepID=A0ABW8YXJ9_9FLAO
MGITTYEVMYIQARDNYPYNVEECIEKLQYVIAADNEHAGAHYLMGQIYEEQLTDYKQAEYYYRMTLYLDRDFAPVYSQYATMLINLNRIEDAYKIIEASLRVPGIKEAKMDYLKGLLYEKYEMYNTAIDLYNKAKLGGLNNEFISWMDGHIQRVKDKKALQKKLSKKANKNKPSTSKKKQKAS